MDQLRRRVRITHPFHPRCGEELELLEYRRSWGHECVDCLDNAGRRLPLPLSWTDVMGETEPFLAVSDGRCYCRVEDLLRLADLVRPRRP